MLVMRREIFGPVMAVAPVDSLDEAVNEANAIGGAIHTGVFTSNLDTAFRLADELAPADPAQVIRLLRPCVLSLAARPDQSRPPN